MNENIIYKLVDNKCKEIAENGKISLIRPCLEFSNGESNVFSFIKDINELIKNSKDISNIEVDANIVNKIDIWFSTYLKVLNKIDNIENRFHYLSDFEIMLYMYLNTYCTSFTKIDLSNDNIRNDYFKANRIFIKKYTKTHYISLDTNINSFECPVYGYYEGDNLVFVKEKYDDEFICGYLHIHDMKYLNNPTQEEILCRFNKTRKVSDLFRYVTNRWNKLEERRIFLMLEGIEKHKAKIAINNNNNFGYSKLNENIFHYVCKVCDECINYYPKYILLYVDGLLVNKL